MERRIFCLTACRAASAFAFGSALTGCAKSPTSPSDAPLLPTLNGTVAGGSVTVAVDTGSPLAAVGGAALVQSSRGNFLVTRTAQDAFTALTAICTHEGCTITGLRNQIFVCPCHGSQYSSAGAVVSGPAPRPLQAFPATFANGTLTITA